MAITIATVTGYIEAANIAILADDYDEAMKQLAVARSSFAVVPDFERGTAKAEYVRDALDKLEPTILGMQNRAQSASLGIQRSGTKYVRPTA